MSDWRSPESLQIQGRAFSNVMHALSGVYMYECVLSLEFDWAYISGKRTFRWPMIFYFANRYLLLVTMIGILVALDSPNKLNCQPLYTFNEIAGGASVGLASINLAIRTVAIWSRNKWVIGGLVLIICGHWSLILQGGQLKAVWVDGVGCVITEIKSRALAALFIYSMCFDFLILAVNSYKLWHLRSGAPGTTKANGLSQIIFKDGLFFFFIAFIFNLVAAIFMELDLSQIMSVIFNVPSAIFGTIVACRAVQRLSNFTYEGHTGSTTLDPSVPDSTRLRFAAPPTNQSVSQKQASRMGIQMDTLRTADREAVLGLDKPGRTAEESTVNLSFRDMEAKGEGR